MICFKLVWYEQERKQEQEESQESANKQLALEAAQADKARDLSNEVSKCSAFKAIGYIVAPILMSFFFMYL